MYQQDVIPSAGGKKKRTAVVGPPFSNNKSSFSILKKPNWNDPPDIHKKNDDYQQDKYPSWLPHETDITKASHAFPT